MKHDDLPMKMVVLALNIVFFFTMKHADLTMNMFYGCCFMVKWY